MHLDRTPPLAIRLHHWLCGTDSESDRGGTPNASFEASSQEARSWKHDSTRELRQLTDSDQVESPDLRLERPENAGATALKELLAGATVVGVNATGFSAYQGSSVILHTLSRGALPFAVYKGASTFISYASGPVGYILIGISALKKLYKL